MPTEHLGALVDSAIRDSPDTVFMERVVDGHLERTTYAEEGGVVRGVRDRLAGLGVGTSDRVVLQVDDLVDCVHLALACFHGGIVPVFLAESFTAAYAQAVADRCSATRVLTATDLHDLSSLADPAGIGDPGPVGDPGDLCLVQPTSGSTGEPKLVLTPHLSFTFGAARIFAGALPPDVDDHRILLVSSIAHGIGMVNLVGALLQRATLTIPSAWDTSVDRREVLALEPTFVYTTPRTVAALVGQAPSGVDEPALGPRVRTLVVAGASPDEAVLNRLHGDGVTLHEMYGSSEAGDLAMTPRGQWRPGWIGPALPGVVLSLSAEGELLALTPGRMLGYEGDADATRQVVDADGTCRTGDLAEFDADGWIRLVGRRVAVINTSEGSNVHPERIEEMLRGAGGSTQVVVVGNGRPHLVALFADDRTGEHPPLVEADIDRRLAEVNLVLEPIEAVRGHLLIDGPLDAGGYEVRAHDKVRIDRASLERTYVDELDACYAAVRAGAVR